ncbi:hypothetical protein ElyMa_004173900 [Elysia marginata]|uniref:Uncharacterized protein n=1 Tax=Elysia marginata TaxID=1093978 RepID=A0AAV4GJ25_9GAST|nr:hypothetical protein ElyMa_004173900 [Elysia marginata]
MQTDRDRLGGKVGEKQIRQQTPSVRAFPEAKNKQTPGAARWSSHTIQTRHVELAVSVAPDHKSAAAAAPGSVCPGRLLDSMKLDEEREWSLYNAPGKGHVLVTS